MGKVPFLLRDLQQSAALLRPYQGLRLRWQPHENLLDQVQGRGEVPLLRFQVQQLRSHLCLQVHMRKLLGARASVAAALVGGTVAAALGRGGAAEATVVALLILSAAIVAIAQQTLP